MARKWTFDRAIELPWLRRVEVAWVIRNEGEKFLGDGDYNLVLCDEVCDRFVAKRKPEWMKSLMALRRFDEVIAWLYENQKELGEVAFQIRKEHDRPFNGDLEKTMGKLFDLYNTTRVRIAGVETWMAKAYGGGLSGRDWVIFKVEDWVENSQNISSSIL